MRLAAPSVELRARTGYVIVHWTWRHALTGLKKTKYAIENATKTRIVLAGSRIHILGAFENIGMARERYVLELWYRTMTLTEASVVSLVLGAQPGKVYNSLRIISSRMKERF